MSNNDLVLLSLIELSKSNRKITSEKLAVHVYKKHKKIFCMKEYPEYPNTNTIYRMISTLNSEGKIHLVKQKIIVTDIGKEYAKLLIKNNEKTNIKDHDINQVELKEIRRLRNLIGLNIFIKNNEKLPIDMDVYEFYGITVRTPLKETKKKKEIVDVLIEKIKKHKNQSFNNLIIYKEKIDEVLKGLIDEYNSART